MNACAIPDAARAGDGAAPGRDRGEDRDPERAADLVASRVEAGDHPRLLIAGTGEDGDRDGDGTETPSPSPATSIPGRTSRT